MEAISKIKKRKLDTDVLEVIKESKYVLLQLDQRHNGKCYNPMEDNCQCTLCKIEKVLKSVK